MSKPNKTQALRTVTSLKQQLRNIEMVNEMQVSQSCAVSTERTIFSPFTKEYRVFATQSGICLLWRGFSFGGTPTQKN